MGTVCYRPLILGTETQPPMSFLLGASEVATQSGHDAQEARLRWSGQTKQGTIGEGASARPPVAAGDADQPKPYTCVGLVPFQGPKDGTCRVVTDEDMRTDVVADGKLVDSTAFGHGPHCSGSSSTFVFTLTRPSFNSSARRMKRLPF